jgi:uncharacterized protein (DUF1330 family)
VVAETHAIHDEARMVTYRQAVEPQIEKWGGKVLGIGTNQIEGEPFDLLMVQEWPSKERFLEWQASDEYRPYLEIRRTAADIRSAFVPLISEKGS